MNFGLSEEQELLRKTARGFLEERAPLAFAREVLERGPAHARELWPRVAELGWPGLHVPEAFGGAGLGEVELCILLEEFGRNLVPLPFLPHALATTAVLELGDAAQRARWLPELASGRILATLSLASLDAHAAPAQPLALEARADGYALSGAIEFVPDAGAAQLLIVAARAGDHAVAFTLPTASAGCRSSPMALDSCDRCSRDARRRPRAVGCALGGAANSATASASALPALLLLGAEIARPRSAASRPRSLAKQRVQFAADRRTMRSITSAPTCCSAARRRRSILSTLCSRARATLRHSTPREALPSERRRRLSRACAENLQIHGGAIQWEYTASLPAPRAHRRCFFGSRRSSGSSAGLERAAGPAPRSSAVPLVQEGLHALAAGRASGSRRHRVARKG